VTVVPDSVEQTATPPQARPFVWPFPKNGIPTPPSARQLKRDEREELAQLGEGLF
jgi:hypothetical protein